MRGLISYPDFYKVAVSSAAVYDNVLDQTSWIETFLGPYDQELYDQQSMFTQVEKIRGRLLIVTGELDENVPYSNALKMVKAMIAADKDVDLLVFPDMDHWYVYHPYFYRKYWN